MCRQSTPIATAPVLRCGVRGRVAEPVHEGQTGAAADGHEAQLHLRRLTARHRAAVPARRPAVQLAGDERGRDDDVDLVRRLIARCDVVVDLIGYRRHGHSEERHQNPSWEKLQRDDFRAYLRFLGRRNLGRSASGYKGKPWSGSFKKPCPGSITSGFGYRKHPLLQTVRAHLGVDWSGPIGSPIMATGNGAIVQGYPSK